MSMLHAAEAAHRRQYHWDRSSSGKSDQHFPAQYHWDRTSSNKKTDQHYLNKTTSSSSGKTDQHFPAQYHWDRTSSGKKTDQHKLNKTTSSSSGKTGQHFSAYSSKLNTTTSSSSGKTGQHFSAYSSKLNTTTSSSSGNTDQHFSANSSNLNKTTVNPARKRKYLVDEDSGYYSPKVSKDEPMEIDDEVVDDEEPMEVDMEYMEVDNPTTTNPTITSGRKTFLTNGLVADANINVSKKMNSDQKTGRCEMDKVGHETRPWNKSKGGHDNGEQWIRGRKLDDRRGDKYTSKTGSNARSDTVRRDQSVRRHTISYDVFGNKYVETNKNNDRKDQGDANLVKNSAPCRYYAQGTCMYGDQCKYAHIGENVKNQHKLKSLTDQRKRSYSTITSPFNNDAKLAAKLNKK